MERIIVVSGVNEAELLRTLSWHGCDSFGLRVTDPANLALLALIKEGDVPAERVIGSGEQETLIADVLEKLCPESFSEDYGSIKKLSSSLSALRMRLADNEEEQLREKLTSGEFTDKNRDLLDVYEAYMKECRERGIIDGISLIRRACGLCGRMDGTELLTLAEYSPGPAEKALIDKLGGARELTLKELFGASGDKPVNAAFVPAYGAVNEVLYVLEKILSSKDRRFDSCTVAAADPALYSQLFFELGRRYGLNMTFGCGIPMGNTVTADLLKKLARWSGAGMQSRAALLDLIYCAAFDREKLRAVIGGEGFKELRPAVELAGGMRLGTDAALNTSRIGKAEKKLAEDDRKALMPAVRNLAKELEKGTAYLIGTYFKPRKSELGAFDSAAKTEVLSRMNDYASATGRDPSELIPSLLGGSVCRKAREAGALHITSIEKAAFSLRDSLFIVGLSADCFPGAAAEDPFVLDSDFLLFEDEASAPTSENNIRKRVENIKALAGLAKALGNDVFLSYSELRAAELKQANMSSAVTELYNSLVPESERLNYDKLAETKPAVYFSDALTFDREIGRSFCAGERLAPKSRDTAAAGSVTVNCFDDKEYSPSEIDRFYKCPRQYFFRNVLGIKEPDNGDDLTDIEANELGTIIHRAMEEVARRDLKMSREEFRAYCYEQADEFLSLNVPVSETSADKAKDELVELALRVYDKETGASKKVIFAEENLRAVHSSGVRLFGLPDRVEEQNGEYLIGDYKTGKRIAQNDDDPRTWLQTMCYAFLMGHNDPKVDIDRIEYRYPRLGKEPGRAYDQKELDKILDDFADCLKKGYFPAVTEKDDPDNPAITGGSPCSYCSMKGICGKGDK